MASTALMPFAHSLTRRNPTKSLLYLVPHVSQSLRYGVPLSSACTSASFPGFRTSARKRVRIGRLESVSGQNLSALPSKIKNYEFSDGPSEVELRVDLCTTDTVNPKDISVDVDDFSLRVRVRTPESMVTLVETSQLYDRIKPSETIWYIDEDQLVVNLKKCDADLKWPDLVESWVSLTTGVAQLLKGTSVYIVGNSTSINQKIAAELASGLGYTPLITSELLERYAQQSIDSWVIAEGEDSVAEAEGSVFESLSSHIRTVVATLGGQHGAAARDDKWRHLYAGFTIWLSQSEATDEASAKEEVRRHIQDGSVAYSNAEVVVKLGGWDPESAQTVAQACLSALKRLLLSDKELTGKKGLYIRLGCRGDWPNIKPPGWDPSSAANNASGF